MDGFAQGQGSDGAVAVPAVESIPDSAPDSLDRGDFGEGVYGGGFQGGISSVRCEIGGASNYRPMAIGAAAENREQRECRIVRNFRSLILALQR